MIEFGKVKNYVDSPVNYSEIISGDKGVYRISNASLTNVNGRPENVAMLNNYNGTTWWFSIINYHILMEVKMGIKCWLNKLFKKNENNDVIIEILESDNSNKIISDLLLMDTNGKINKIDYVVIRDNGIFSIMVKDLNGQLYGNIDNEYWNQSTFDSDYRFNNPIKQNKKCIYHINKVLNNKYKVNSLIILNQNNGVNIKIDNVIDRKNLKSYLEEFNNDVHYSDDEKESIYKLLIDASKAKINTNNKEEEEKVY
jgi:hypothetical protein